MRSIAMTAATCVAAALLSGPVRAQNGSRPGALSLIEAGFAADGSTPRYTLEANGADLRDVLAALLRKTGKEFVINQDVTGPISLELRDRTLDEILSYLAKVAHPPIVVKRGDMITVATAPPVVATGEAAGAKPDAQAARNEKAQSGDRGRLAVFQANYAQFVPGQTLTLGQPVNLVIPDERPMPLRTVLRQIEGQTRVPIRLDPRVPADVGVAARFTETPLSLVLESIGRTGALKWQLRPDGSVLITPSDWLLVTVRGVPTWSNPSVSCPGCGRPVLPSWSFCPHDGKPLSIRNQQRAIQGKPR